MTGLKSECYPHALQTALAAALPSAVMLAGTSGAELFVLDALRNGNLLGWDRISRAAKHCLIDPEPMIILVRMPL
jgi:hypothetical protein